MRSRSMSSGLYLVLRGIVLQLQEDVLRGLCVRLFCRPWALPSSLLLLLRVLGLLVLK
jgi:hypothetical protein